MRRARSVAAAVAVLALAGCADDATGGGPADGPSGTADAGLESGGEPADPPGLDAVPGVTVASEVVPGESSVTVGYTLTNESDGPVLVPNLLPKSTGLPDEEAGTVYVTGTGDAEVTIAQRVFASPDTDRVDRAQVPRVGVTEVAPGATLDLDLTVPVPLERRQPFGEDLGYGAIALPDPVEELRFCLGVLPAPYPEGLGLERADGVPTIAHGDPAAEAQWLACSDPVPA